MRSISWELSELAGARRPRFVTFARTHFGHHCVSASHPQSPSTKLRGVFRSQLFTVAVEKVVDN